MVKRMDDSGQEKLGAFQFPPAANAYHVYGIETTSEDSDGGASPTADAQAALKKRFQSVDDAAAVAKLTQSQKGRPPAKRAAPPAHRPMSPPPAKPAKGVPKIVPVLFTPDTAGEQAITEVTSLEHSSSAWGMGAQSLSVHGGLSKRPSALELSIGGGGRAAPPPGRKKPKPDLLLESVDSGLNASLNSSMRALVTGEQRKQFLCSGFDSPLGQRSPAGWTSMGARKLSRQPEGVRTKASFIVDDSGDDDESRRLGFRQKQQPEVQAKKKSVFQAPVKKPASPLVAPPPLPPPPPPPETVDHGAPASPGVTRSPPERPLKKKKLLVLDLEAGGEGGGPSSTAALAKASARRGGAGKRPAAPATAGLLGSPALPNTASEIHLPGSCEDAKLEAVIQKNGANPRAMCRHRLMLKHCLDCNAKYLAVKEEKEEELALKDSAGFLKIKVIDRRAAAAVSYTVTVGELKPVAVGAPTGSAVSQQALKVNVKELTMGQLEMALEDRCLVGSDREAAVTRLELRAEKRNRAGKKPLMRYEASDLLITYADKGVNIFFTVADVAKEALCCVIA